MTAEMMTPKMAANISYHSSLPVNSRKYTAKKQAITIRIVVMITIFFCVKFMILIV